MKKRLLSILLTMCMVIALLPTAAFAAETAKEISGEISTNATWNEDDTIRGAVTIIGGTEADPVVITVTGTVNVYNGITVSSGYVKFTGVGTLNGFTNSSFAIITVTSGATLTMDGTTTISGNGGGGVKVNNGGTFNMNGGTIGGADEAAANKATYGGGVYVETGGTFNMSDGTISGNTAGNNSSGSGGGVYVKGTFNMTGGTIGGANEAAANEAAYGGGVYVNSGIFTMSGGTIGGNKAGGNMSSGGGGGGVYVYRGTFNMSGGTISDNKANGSESKGGGVYINGGTFTMSETGTISGNTASTYGGNGGGVYINEGTFTMNNGIISGNSSNDGKGGGVYISKNNTFTMNGGTISGNTASEGGGVNIEIKGTLNMSGGSITGNNATKNGGGVNLNGEGILTMSGGSITGNNATNNGGGVNVARGAILTMSGGSITGNNATTGNGGVNVEGTMRVSGTAIVNGNVKGGTILADTLTGGTINNVYLQEDCGITISAALTDSASIGVTTEKLPIERNPVNITDYTTIGDFSGRFLSDNPLYEIIKVEGYGNFKVQLKIIPHEHGTTWTYAASGETITAKCEKNGCPTETLTIVKPARTVFGGSEAAEATLSDVTGFASALKDVQATSIKYAGTGATSYTESTTAPTNAGSYKASITVDTDKTASVEYTIGKAKATVTTDPTANIVTYSGSAQALVTAGITAHGTMNYSLTGTEGTWVTTIPQGTEAGDYTVYYKAVGSGNYCDSDIGSVNVTIAKAVATFTKTPAAIADLTYNGNPQALVTAGTTDHGTVKYSLDNSTWSEEIPTGTNAGSYAVYCKATGDANHDDFSQAINVTIEKQSVEAPTIVSKTYTGETLTADVATSAEYTVTTNDGGINAGDYNVVLTASDNYKWSDSEEAAKTVTFTITKGTFKDLTATGSARYGASGTVDLSSKLASGGRFANILSAIEDKVYYLNGTLTIEDGKLKFTLANTAANVGKTFILKVHVINATNYEDYYIAVTITINNVAPSDDEENNQYTPPVKDNVDSNKDVTAADLKALAKDNKSLTVTGKNGEKLVLDADTVKELANDGGKLNITVDDAKGKLTPEQAAQAGDRPVYSLTAMLDGKAVESFDGEVTVSLPYTLKEGENPENVTVWYLASDGTMTELSCKYDPKTGLVTFVVTHFSEYVVGIKAKEWVNPFTDVKDSDWFYAAVKYANENSIFSGTTATTFAPNDTTTRAMLWTVLAHQDGQETTGGSVWYEKGMNWAKDNGISDGTNPNGSITREQLVSMLWRYAGAPSAKGNLSKFSDADSVADYAKQAMAWAVENGIVSGTSNAKLSPKGGATRAQVAVMLTNYCENVTK